MISTLVYICILSFYERRIIIIPTPMKLMLRFGERAQHQSHQFILGTGDIEGRDLLYLIDITRAFAVYFPFLYFTWCIVVPWNLIAIIRMLCSKARSSKGGAGIVWRFVLPFLKERGSDLIDHYCRVEV